MRQNRRRGCKSKEVLVEEGELVGEKKKVDFTSHKS